MLRGLESPRADGSSYPRTIAVVCPGNLTSAILGGHDRRPGGYVVFNGIHQRGQSGQVTLRGFDAFESVNAPLSVMVSTNCVVIDNPQPITGSAGL
jgi:hypothetical protein